MNATEPRRAVAVADGCPDLPGFARLGLTPGQARALDALLCERSVAAAAERAGVHERTLRRWLNEDGFRKALQHVQRRAFSESLLRLQAVGARAIEALLGVLEDPRCRPTDRISAARVLLDNAFRAHDAVEVRERLETLEQTVKARAGILQ